MAVRLAREQIVAEKGSHSRTIFQRGIRKSIQQPTLISGFKIIPRVDNPGRKSKIITQMILIFSCYIIPFMILRHWDCPLKESPI